MNKRYGGYAVWLLLTACLYFFENNTGTRTVLICSLVLPLLPFLRPLFFAEDQPEHRQEARKQPVRVSAQRQTEEPDGVRKYQPGDPVRRIHWKLSAKRDELLVRETGKAPEAGQAEEAGASDGSGRKGSLRKQLPWLLAGLTVLCGILLLILPEARYGAQALCNRLFTASEAVNAYAYEHFPVVDPQSVALAAALIAAQLLALAALTVLRGSRLMALCILAALALGQVYFGLSFPSWLTVLLYASFALWMIRRPLDRRKALICAGAILAAAALVAALFPGVDATTEAASERARDWLNRMALSITGTVSELPEDETETRHVHSQSLVQGEREAQTGRAYRLVTVEEEQISLPRFINWLRTILLFLLVIALIVLPYIPFALLEARRKKAQKAQKIFAAENVSDAVRGIFQQVILWLRETGHDAGNLLYRDWTEQLPACLSEGYRARFAACVKDYEEALYSPHELPEAKRERALTLLKETEAALWQTADRRQRFRIRYWMCLRE